jgi:hypothetical protein
MRQRQSRAGQRPIAVARPNQKRRDHTQLPIDTANLTLLAGRVEPAIDFETRLPRADANGEPVYGVDVVAFGAEAPQIWRV